VLLELKIIRERAQEYEEQPSLVRDIVGEGCQSAREVAQATLDEVRQATFLRYR